MKLHAPPTLGVDISEWQHVVSSVYEYPVFKARVHNGYRLDRAFASNAHIIDSLPGVKVRAAYIVPVAGMNLAAAVDAVMSVLPAGWCVMIDEESGPGFHGPGDHSDVLNDLRGRFIERLGGNRRMVWGYANGGDWASGWPRRGDTPMVVAKYSAYDNDLIRSAQCIGWQYSNGQPSNGVPANYPRGSRAVGACDMNVYGFASGDEFAAWLGLADGVTASPTTAVPTEPVQEDDMPTLVIADGRGFGLLLGDQLTHLVDPASIDSAKAAAFPQWQISAVEWDNIRGNGSGAGTLFHGPTGFAVQVAGELKPHAVASMPIVENYRAAGYVEVQVDDVEWTALGLPA